MYDVGSDKLRLGRDSDGGYIINQTLLNNSSKLITLGYGNEDSFEIDWYKKTNTPIDIYDGTCTCQGICNLYPELLGNTLNYYQQNVGNYSGQIPLSHIIETAPTNSLLKVDIEGGEYSVFDNIDLSSHSGILIEFHNLDNAVNRFKLSSLITNEFSPFLLFHIHANNWTDTFELEEGGIIMFPQTIEIYLINKKLVSNSTVDISYYPIDGLDKPNHSGRKEISLPWVNSQTK